MEWAEKEVPYMAFDLAKGDDVCVIAVDYKEWQRLKSIEAEHQALLNSVVLLEDDAEPIEGDYIAGDACADYVDNFTLTNWTELKPHYRAIIQRNGKPVIYKSTLNTVKENGE